MGKCFCNKCKSFVEYNTRERKIIERVNGKICVFTEVIAICKNCGSEVYVSEIEDENMKNFLEVYGEVDSYAI